MAQDGRLRVLERVTTAVVPVAGRGTRMRPATRALPKEMLPVGDRPVVQHVVEELAASGIERVVFVTAPGKEAIAEHFVGDTAGVALASVVQAVPRGLGDAVLQAHGLVGDERFAIALGDCIVGTTCWSSRGSAPRCVSTVPCARSRCGTWPRRRGATGSS